MDDLYFEGLKFADEHGYCVCEMPFGLKAFSICDGGRCGIALDHQLLDDGEATTALWHELGHCETGSFYYENTPASIKARCEIHADKWAIQQLIPKAELDVAIAKGTTEIWDLADYFNVTEEFMRKALCWYFHGNLSPNLYL